MRNCEFYHLFILVLFQIHFGSGAALIQIRQEFIFRILIQMRQKVSGPTVSGSTTQQIFTLTYSPAFYSPLLLALRSEKSVLIRNDHILKSNWGIPKLRKLEYCCFFYDLLRKICVESG